MTVPDLTQPQTRSYATRAQADGEKREIHGVGVPLADEIEVFPGFREMFDQECEFEGIERAKLAHRHGEVIGVTFAHERAAGQLKIRTRVSQTRAGDDALALARDGAYDSFSIGFTPVEWTVREDDVVVYHKVRVREFSLVPYPAYENAVITEIRETPAQPNALEGSTRMTTTQTEVVDGEKFAAELAQIREEQAEFLRTVVAHMTRAEDGGERTGEMRSAGAILQAIVSGDEQTREYVNQVMERAYTGGTSADSPIKDGWVGDLTRIFDASSGVLSAFFSEGVLPEKGMNIEFARLATNTVQVTEQANEGDDLAYGKVTLTTETAPVKTYGGYTQLTRQAILRSTLPILDRSLEAMGIAAGARKKIVMRAAYLALVAERTAIAGGAGVLPLGDTLAAADAYAWTDLVVDAAIRFDSINMPLDGLIVSPAVFKRLNRLEISGHKVFRVASERNLIGTLDLSGISGDLAGIAVVGDPGRTGEAAEFASRRALRQYDSAVVQLQDENIINLSKDFSVYRFGAVADEIPEAVVPVDFTAAAAG